jgi:hypothetical protein
VGGDVCSLTPPPNRRFDDPRAAEQPLGGECLRQAGGLDDTTRERTATTTRAMAWSTPACATHRPRRARDQMPASGRDLMRHGRS